MNNIKRVSLFFRIIFQLLFVMVPLVLVVSWLYAPQPLILLGGTLQLNAIPHMYMAPSLYAKGMHFLTVQSGLSPGFVLHTLSNSEKALGFLVSTIPMAIELFILYCLIKLFGLYAAGEIFSLNNVRYIRNIGYALLMGQLINPFYEFFLGLILTWHNPPGYRYAVMRLDQTNFGILLIGILVILISWIMAEGCKLREEQQLTI